MNPPNSWRSIPLACLSIVVSSLYAAEGLKTLPDSAEAMGKVGARFATLSDPSVVRVNPASMVDLEGTQFNFNFQLWHGETDFVQAGSNLGVSMIDHVKPTGSFYLSHQLSDRLTAGIGVSAPFGIAISWPQQGAFRYATPYEIKLQTVAINPAIGYKFSDKLSVGAGLDIFHSSLRVKQVYPWSAALGFPGLADGNQEIDGSGWGLGAYASMNLALSDRQRLAIIGRLPVAVDFEGYSDFSNVPIPGVASRTEFRSDMEFPASVQVGYGFDLNDKTTIGFDFDWTMNSSHDDLPLNVGANQFLLPNDRQVLDWKDAYSVGTGISTQITEQLVLRGGYLFTESPMNDRFYTPSVPANDRHIFSAGLGYQINERILFDFAYSCVHLESHEVLNNVNPALNGHYDYSWHIFTLGITQKF